VRAFGTITVGDRLWRMRSSGLIILRISTRLTCPERRHSGRRRITTRLWIGDLAYEPAGICVWACGKVGIESQQDELLQSAMDELNRLIKEKLEYLKGFVNE
jgi:hypothetical protein